MNRRDFSKTAGMVAVAAVVAPKILAEQENPRTMVRLYRDENGKFQTEEIPNHNTDSYFEDKTTPEQCAAIKRMEDNMPSRDLFSRVADEFPQKVSNATDKKGFQHGAARVLGWIDGHPRQALEDGTVKGSVDLSNIGYVGMYRQGVRNKYTNQIKLFVATIPSFCIKEVNPGQTIEVDSRIPIGTSDVEIERMARESFAKLQELVVEYHNRVA